MNIQATREERAIYTIELEFDDEEYMAYIDDPDKLIDIIMDAIDAHKQQRAQGLRQRYAHRSPCPAPSVGRSTRAHVA